MGQPTKRAGLYARVSTTEQAKEGYSIEAQIEALRAYARDREWTVIGEYVDAGFSGSNANRPAFQQLLEHVEARALDVVLVYRLDRFFRNQLLQGMILEQFEELGIQLVSVTEGINSASWFDMAIRGVLNEQEARTIRERARMGKKARAKTGHTNASHLPYGYKRERIGRKTWAEPEPDPELAAAVIAAFEAYASGEYTDQELADLLQQKGYPTYARDARRWTRGAVRKMLQNPYYAGWVNYYGELHDGKHEAIVNRELWVAAQIARGRRSSGAPGGHSTARVYLLHRVARCWHCGGVLHMHPAGRGHFYYRDPAAIRGMDCPVAGRSVPMAIIDDQVSDLVRRLQLPDDWRERLQELAEHQEERERVEGKRQYVEARLRRLRELYVDGDYSREEYDRRRADLQAQLEALQVPDAPAVEEAGETLESLGAEWAKADKRYQRDMLGLIFEAVFVDIEGQRVVCVKPYPPFVPLFRMDGLEEVENGCFRVREEAGKEAGSEG